MKGQLKTTVNLQGLIFLQQRSPAIFHEAMKRGAIQLLTWCNTGSPRESRKPPIRFGVLRGSSSAFVGSDLVEVFKQSIQPGAIETPDPAMSHSANSKTMTVVWNTNYAKRMHENEYTLGDFSENDGDAGNKWVEKHLQSDKDALMQVIAKEFKRIAKT